MVKDMADLLVRLCNLYCFWVFFSCGTMIPLNGKIFDLLHLVFLRGSLLAGGVLWAFSTTCSGRCRPWKGLIAPFLVSDAGFFRIDHRQEKEVQGQFRSLCCCNRSACFFATMLCKFYALSLCCYFLFVSMGARHRLCTGSGLSGVYRVRPSPGMK